MRRSLFVLAALVLAFPLAALDFSVSPNPDGSFDFSLKHEWSYGAGPFFSGASLQSSSGSSTETSEGYRTMSVSRDFTASLVPLGYQLGSGRSQLRAALDLGWQRMKISELGYVDGYVPRTTNSYRFFMANDRVIDLILPKLRVDSRLGLGPLSLTFGGEYAPWLYVRLDQTLSTAATPTNSSPVYAGSLPADKNHKSEQSAANAFSIDGSAFFRSAFIEPGIEATYDDLSIKYEYLDAFGRVAVSDTRFQTLTIGGSAIFRFAKVAGLSPKVSVSRVLDWADDLADSAGPVASDGEWKLFLGFAR